MDQITTYISWSEYLSNNTRPNHILGVTKHIKVSKALFSSQDSIQLPEFEHDLKQVTNMNYPQFPQFKKKKIVTISEYCYGITGK